MFQLVYTGVSLSRWQDRIRSQGAVGIAGVLLVIFTIAAGLGLCAVLGIAFNATTTQIVPFLALGLGVDNMFLLTHIYAKQTNSDAQFDVSLMFCYSCTILIIIPDKCPDKNLLLLLCPL